jgi:hypothetical protein
MAKVSGNKNKYAPEVTVWLDEKVGNDITIEKEIQIPIPEGQEWHYAMLERQGKDLNTIKKWVMFFGILTVLSIILTMYQMIALRQALGL